MTSTLTTIGVARICHAANREFQHVTGDPAPSPEWDDAPDWQQESSLHVVQAALSGATPEQLHDAWRDEKTAGGWVYGETKDADARTHPCMVAYADLPADQQTKDALFGAIVGALLGEPAEKATVRTYRVQYNPGQDVDGDSETFIAADSYQRSDADQYGSRWIQFHRGGRIVAEVREAVVLVIEEIEPLTDKERADLEAAVGRHPAGSQLADEQTDWSAYHACGTCGQPTGQPCLYAADGEARINPHHYRDRLTDVTAA